MINNDSRSKKIDEGLRKAVAKEITRHKKLKQSIAIWKNGKVVVMPAAKVKISKKK